MKTNAKEYLLDVAVKRIGRIPILMLFWPSFKKIKADQELESVLNSSESRLVHPKRLAVNGERIEIQITDRRKQYEERKKRAELSGLGF